MMESQIHLVLDNNEPIAAFTNQADAEYECIKSGSVLSYISIPVNQPIKVYKQFNGEVMIDGNRLHFLSYTIHNLYNSKPHLTISKDKLKFNTYWVSVTEPIESFLNYPDAESFFKFKIESIIFRYGENV